MAEPLTLINAFEVPSDEADRFIAAWEKTRDYLATQPGYVDTALHQAVSPRRAASNLGTRPRARGESSGR
jgi:heme oxygenase (mycobilin-producing)